MSSVVGQVNGVSEADKFLFSNQAAGYLKQLNGGDGVISTTFATLITEGKIKHSYNKGPVSYFKLTAQGWEVIKRITKAGAGVQSI